MDCWKQGAWGLVVGLVLPLAVARAESPMKDKPGNDKPAAESAPLNWLTDYVEATRLGEAQKKMVLVYFRGTGTNRLRDELENKSFEDAKVSEKLNEYILVRLPLDAEIVSKGEKVKLLSHRSFHELEGKEGLAVIDYAHRDTEHYGYVVTSLPLVNSRYYSFRANHLAVILDLPAGTLTQRTMVFAVRIHPEAPQSTIGDIDHTLLKEAASHSNYQAQITVQGHHHWDSRYQRISNRLPDGLRAQEVVAESWPHEGLLDAACDCVHSWRQSSGHWSAVRAWQPRFGYDMRRGSNGIWYATGLFGNRH